MLLLTALTLFANSCSTTDAPPPKPLITADAALADAAAAMETMMALSEFAVTPVSAFFVGAAAAVAAADASCLFCRNVNPTHSFGKVNNIALPTANLMYSNPLENIGDMHNIGLNYLNGKGDLATWHSRFANYEIDAWKEILKVVRPGMTISEQMQVIDFAKQFKVIENLQAKSIYTAQTNRQELISKLNLSPLGKSYIDLVITTCNKMLSSGSTILQVTDYLNSEIAGRLNPENAYTAEETGILTFLTVLKHSSYYWLN